MTITKPLRMYEISCCFFTAIVDLIHEAGLTPEHLLEAQDGEPDPVPIWPGGVSHKGPDLECEDCTSIWVTWGSTVKPPQVQLDGKCSHELTRTFQVILALPVCTEEISPCSDDQPNCLAHEPQDGEDPDDWTLPCFDIEPKIGNGKCSKKERPTIAEETAFIYAVRDLLETKLACEAECCIQDCAGMRCKSSAMTSSEYVVEGGCAIMTFNIEVTV